MTAAIQKREPSILDTLVTPTWPLGVIDVLRKLKVPKGCTDEEFYVFLRQCQQSGLNPILGHAYCVPRRTKVSAKGEPDKWVTNHVFQPAIDGMRARAAEFHDFDMSDSAAIYEKDLITLDKGKGEISHKTNPVGQRGRIVGAWGRVRKKNGTAVVVELPVTARSGDSHFWTGDPGGMLAKCAEAAALRKAFPVAFSGMHIPEEMPQDDVREPTRAEAVLSSAQGAPPADGAPALPPPGPVVKFGVLKDRLIASLSREEVEAAIKEGEWNKDQHPKMAAKVRANLDANLEHLRAALDGPSTPAASDVEDAEEVPSAPVSANPAEQGAEPPAGMRLPGE